jgi:predicted transcriptional regulator
MSTKMQVEWRRAKVLEMISKGNSQTEIAGILQVDLSIVSRDVSYLRQQAKQNIKRYIDERLPEEYEKCLVGLTSILKEAWNAATDAEDKREKIQALSLAKECYGMKLELLTNATVVDDAIRFVSDRANVKLRSFSNSSNKSQLQEEEQQKDKTTAVTVNQLF